MKNAGDGLHVEKKMKTNGRFTKPRYIGITYSRLKRYETVSMMGMMTESIIFCTD